MDYKEKYTDFLDRLNNLLDETKKKGHIIARVEDIEEAFPELKESEDEKVRKAIHIYLDWLDGRKDYAPKGEYSIKDMIAWLEKQKVLSTEEDKQGKEYVLWCIKQAKKYAKDENEMGTCWLAEKWLEKQGEQKPFEPINLRTWKYIVDAVLTEREGIGQYLDDVRTEMIAKKLQDRFGNIEQKSVEWSEADKRIIEGITAYLCTHDSCEIEGFDEWYTWLKSITKRMRPLTGEQKPVEKPIKGNYYTCTKDYQFCEHDNVTFEKGKVYKCEEDGKITSDLGGLWPFSNVAEFFRLSTGEEIRNYLQKSIEWGEEDEDIYNGIIQCVYDNVSNIGTVNKNKYIDWLKAIKLIVNKNW